MARRRGFFAELQYQQQLAEKRELQAQRAHAREHARVVREAHQAQLRADRAAATAARASIAEQKTAEKEAQRLRLEARAAEVAALNSRIAEVADELDSILAATLSVDDHVDLSQLRATAEHPPFPRTDLEVPTPQIELVTAPPEPVFIEPEAPTGMGRVFGGKKKHEAAIADARKAFEAERESWRAEAAAVPGQQLEQIERRNAEERRRLEHLQAAKDAHRGECEALDAVASETNGRLDALTAGLALGEHSAVREYVGIVLGNSVYPEALDVEHDFSFDPAARELSLTVLISPPSELPAEKAYRYVKGSDEIVATELAKKDLKARYLSIVEQVAIRSLHEIFEADRSGVIQTIALEVATESPDPATGLQKRVVFVGAAADRDAFTSFDLANVVPAATLQHLGAAISKSPVDLVGIGSSPGVRGRE